MRGRGREEIEKGGATDRRSCLLLPQQLIYVCVLNFPLYSLGPQLYPDRQESKENLEGGKRI